MQKGKFLESLKREVLKNGVGSSDDLGKVTMKQIEVVASYLWSDVIMMLVKKEEELDWFCKSYYDIPVQFNENTNQYYASLPVSTIQLPDNGGIRVIKAIGSGRIFYRSSVRDVDLNEDSELKGFYDRTLYVVEGQTRVVFYNYDYAQKNIRKLHMRLIPDFMTYTMDEELPLPSGRILEVTNMIAKQFYSNKKVLDTSADGV
jgi:hypothetical protein